MIRPKVSYAHTDDGVTIAYSVLGEGPLTIVVVQATISQLEVIWEEPAFEHFMSCLAGCMRVVVFDRRGTGLSDQFVASGDRLALERMAADVEAVMNASGTPAAALLGVSQGGMTAIQFAAEHPERTLALALFGASARLTQAPDHPLGVDPTVFDGWVAMATGGWGTGVGIEILSPSMAGDDRHREWVGRLERHACSPSMIEAALRISAGYDVRSLLPDLRVPTLVLHRVDERVVTLEQARYLAAQIAGARLVELPGEDHVFFLGDQEPLLDALIGFLDEHVARGALRRRIRQLERRSAFGYGWDSLTPDEREVSTLAATGLTNAQIAERLRKSRHTVDGRLRRAFAKLNVTSRVELSGEYSRLAR